MKLSFHVYDQENAKYNAILGIQGIIQLKMKIEFGETPGFEWGDMRFPMGASKNRDMFLNSTPNLTGLKESKYEKANLQEQVKKAKNLQKSEQSALETILQNHKSLFQGKLGTAKVKPVEFELKDGAKLPTGARPITVPQAHREARKR